MHTMTTISRRTTSAQRVFADTGILDFTHLQYRHPQDTFRDVSNLITQVPSLKITSDLYSKYQWDCVPRPAWVCAILIYYLLLP